MIRKIRHEWLRLVSVGCVLLFAILPLLTLAFHITGADWEYILRDSSFRESVRNSLLYTFIAATITTVLALIAAYLLNTSGLKRKNIPVVLLTLGMLVPTVSVGLGLRILFGTNGFLDLLFGWKIEVLGLPGLILGSVMTSFPATFLILYDSLHYEDKGPYDAAAIMGISRLSTFFRLTVPYLRIALISAFCACFTLIFSDYGIPMEIAGKMKTLPMYLYDQFLSSFQYGRGSIAGFVLLIPAIVSFVFDLIFRDQSVSEKQKRLIPSGKGFSRAAVAVIAVLCFLFRGERGIPVYLRLVSFVLVFLVHESLHILVVYSGGDIYMTRRGLYFWLQPDMEMSRGRFFLFMSLPLLALTVLPAVLLLFVSGPLAPWLKWIAWINAFIAGSDIINTALIPFKPRDAKFYWGYYRIGK